MPKVYSHNSKGARSRTRRPATSPGTAYAFALTVVPQRPGTPGRPNVVYDCFGADFVLGGSLMALPMEYEEVLTERVGDMGPIRGGGCPTGQSTSGMRRGWRRPPL
jgi:hypothetical protein